MSTTDAPATTSVNGRSYIGVRTRMLLAAGGVVMSGLSVVMGLGVFHAWVGHDAWNSVAGFGALAMATAVIAVQSLYVGLTGRVRGRVNRWLRAISESLVNVKAP